ncbi:MAG: O-antigen ligase family protein [Isosphaeraceae bacterium]
MGELARRAALGLTAALLAARAYTTSEPDMDRGAGGGLLWVLALLVVAGVAILGGMIGGRFRFRFSWTDLAVVALMGFVAASAYSALDHRPAISLAWEWAGFGTAYVLLRNLPRTRAESSALAAAMVATAFAVSVYGCYQSGVEIPLIQQEYQRNPVLFLQRHSELGIVPGTPQQAVFERRLLGSNEITSTFALANSLAGFLVGPLVVLAAAWLGGLRRREGQGTPWGALLAALPVVLVLLIVLILTKSRSAYIGLGAGLAVVFWQLVREIPARRIAWAAGLGGVVIAGLIGLGLATGRLDREVLTQSTLSLRYRWEYWQATWKIITGGAREPLEAAKAAVMRPGVGPGNFRAAYLFYKLPQASEEILDPHDMFLEVWAVAGFWAFLALTAALGVGLWNILARSRGQEPGDAKEQTGSPASRDSAKRASRDVDEGDAPPRGTSWLIAAAGAGWPLVIALGMMNLFESDMFARWLILGAGWLVAAIAILPLWSSRSLSPVALGGAVVAVAVNLLAAGGIGIPTVALAFWATLALGLNLREDRACGRLREVDSRIPPIVLSAAWAALVGVFFGQNLPYWHAEAALAAAEDAMRPAAPDFERAENAYLQATRADRYYARPWVYYARFAEYAWLYRNKGAKDQRWRKVPELLEKAVSLPRSPNSWVLHRQRAETIRGLMARLGDDLQPDEAVRLSAEIVKEWRLASLLYPTNAMLHAQLAEASVGVSMFGDTIKEAEEALRLDDLMPHLDRKLPKAERARLENLIADAKRREKPEKPEKP